MLRFQGMTDEEYYADRERRIKEFLSKGGELKRIRKQSMFAYDFEYDEYYIELDGEIVITLTLDEYKMYKNLSNAIKVETE